MGRKLYVGNLPFSATESTLSDLFSQVGQVDSARLITDRDSGRSKGFGFVEMGTDEEAQKAIAELFGVSEPAVSQYMHEKRGAEVDFAPAMQKTIADSAKRITDKSTFIKETQQLLHKAWHEKVICGVCHTQNGDAIPRGCAVCFE